VILLSVSAAAAIGLAILATLGEAYVFYLAGS
jgi:hypothetical protein